MVSMQLLLGTVPIAAVLGVNSNGQTQKCALSCEDVKQPLPALCLGMMFPCTWSCQCVGGHEAVSDSDNYKYTNV